MKVVALAALALVSAVGTGAQNKPRVYVTDNPIETFSALVSGRSGVANATKGDDPRTIEIQADFMKSCPNVQVTNDPVRANYVLVFRREGGKRSAMFVFGGLSGLAISAAMKVDNASLFLANGDLVFATKARSVEKAITDVCGRVIPTDVVVIPAPAIPAPAIPVPVVAATPTVVTPVEAPGATVVPIPVATLVPVADPATEPLGDIARRYKNQKQ